MSCPTVSVCVPTYNQVNFIEQCLESILEQKTTFSYEILIGEDESSDGTREICQNFAGKYPDRIRLFLRSRKDVIYINNRPSGRFNMIECLKQAQGKYIALCEGDDYWDDPMKLQKQFDFLEANEDCSAVHHPQMILEGERLFLDGRFEGLTDLSKHGPGSLFSFQIQPQTRCLFFRRIPKEDLTSSFFKKAVYGDFALCFLIAKYGKFGFIDSPMAVYRQHQGGLSSGLIEPEQLFKSRLSLVELWCNALTFLNCDKRNFKIGVLKLYRKGVSRIGKRKAFCPVFVHWFNKGYGTDCYIPVFRSLIKDFI